MFISASSNFQLSFQLHPAEASIGYWFLGETKDFHFSFSQNIYTEENNGEEEEYEKHNKK